MRSTYVVEGGHAGPLDGDEECRSGIGLAGRLLAVKQGRREVRRHLLLQFQEPVRPPLPLIGCLPSPLLPQLLHALPLLLLPHLPIRLPPLLRLLLEPELLLLLEPLGLLA